MGAQLSPLDLVVAEVGNAVAKFPTWPTDPLHALAVLGEEFGELSKAVLQSVYEPHKSSPADVLSEAVQTAAMALRFLASMETYEFAVSDQHDQPVSVITLREITEDKINAVAAKLAASEGLNWYEQCAYEQASVEDHSSCDSSTCVAAHYEDHDPDVARGNYRKWARIALHASIEHIS